MAKGEIALNELLHFLAQCFQMSSATEIFASERYQVNATHIHPSKHVKEEKRLLKNCIVLPFQANLTIMTLMGNPY